jgi:hypothetical protein
MMKLKILAAVLFVALLFSLSLNNQKNTSRDVINHVSTPIPTSSPTDWQTFEDKKYGFSFEYNQNLHLLEQSPTSKEGIESYKKYHNLNLADYHYVLWKGNKVVDLPPELATMHFNPSVIFGVQIITNNTLTPEQYIEKFVKPEYGPDYLTSSNLKKIEVNNNSMYYFNLAGMCEGSFYHSFFKDNLVISFVTSESSLTYETNEEFLKILSSFKFGEKPSQSKIIDSSDFVYTTDGCLRVSSQLYNSQISLTDFIKQKYNLTSDLPLSEKQYKYKNYRSITILPMNMAEVDNIFVDLGKQKLHILIEANNPEGSPVCRLDYKEEIQSIIEKNL